MPEVTLAMDGSRAALGAAPGHELVVDSVRLAYDDDGVGPPVVCLHAIGHGAADFAHLRTHLRARHRVLALDWPGHGRSAADRVPASAARYADLLAGFLEGLRLPPAILIGNSIGGAASVRVAAGQPDRVRALVLENPGGCDRVDRLTRLVTGAMARFFAAGVRGAWWYPRAFAAYYRMVLPAAAAATQRARIVAAGRESAGVLAEGWQSFGRADADQRDLLAAIACPVLVAWAERDRVLQLRRNLPGLQRVPRLRLVRFAAGHAAHLETPEAFESELDAFLEELGEADRADLARAL